MADSVQIDAPATGKRLFWVKTEGAQVSEGEVVATYEAGKGTQGILSPATGTLDEIAVANGALTQSGRPIGYIVL